MEGAEIEILGARAADQLHVVGPEQAKLIIEQFRHAAAAAKAGDPDPPRAHAAPCAAPATELRRDARKAGGFGLKLVGDQRQSALGPRRRALVRAENGEDCSGRRASVRAARNSSQPE